MAVESFDDTSLGNGTVPKVGTRGGAEPQGPPSATGRPSGVRTADGTESPRTEVKTKRAEAPSTPSGSAKFKPSAVQSFKDGL